MSRREVANRGFPLGTGRKTGPSGPRENASLHFHVPTGNPLPAPSLSSAVEGWEASLKVELEEKRGRTVVARRESVGPLVVQRGFYPEGGVCHLYLVHPPGGVVGGDRLHLSVIAREGSQGLITTPAATKFYRSGGRVARQSQEIEARGASVEWLPQETIVFTEARARIATKVRIDARSRFVGWEIACFGRPASGLAFDAGSVAQDFELWRDDVPVMLDHLRLDGAHESMRAPFGLCGHPVLGTMFACPANDAVLSIARDAMEQIRNRDGGRASSAEVVAPEPVAARAAVDGGCSCVDGVLVCRAVGAQADAVRRLFIAIWQRIRPAVIGREAVLPRIWAT